MTPPLMSARSARDLYLLIAASLETFALQIDDVENGAAWAGRLRAIAADLEIEAKVVRRPKWPPGPTKEARDV